MVTTKPSKASVAARQHLSGLSGKDAAQFGIGWMERERERETDRYRDAK